MGANAEQSRSVDPYKVLFIWSTLIDNLRLYKRLKMICQ